VILQDENLDAVYLDLIMPWMMRGRSAVMILLLQGCPPSWVIEAVMLFLQERDACKASSYQCREGEKQRLRRRNSAGTLA